MSKVRVCFLGTPDFAVTSLKALLEDEHYEVVGVVTQPDRPAGRKLTLTPSPVKTLAQYHGIKVLSPESLKDNGMMINAIKTWGAEVAVVVAFGQILTDEFLNLFNFGAVNIHGSLLPRWRGAAPIQRSLQFGDLETGVTLQRIVKKLDAGDVIGFRKCKIACDMTATDLYEKLADLGADLLRVELMDYVRGNLTGTKQDEQQVTVAKKIEKTEALISWNLSALEIHNQVRAFTMGPGTYTFFETKKVKIHKTRAIAKIMSATLPIPAIELPAYIQNLSDRKLEGVKTQALGKVLRVTEESIIVQCGQGELEILELQPESRNKMKVKEFLTGYPVSEGDFFGKSS